MAESNDDPLAAVKADLIAARDQAPAKRRLGSLKETIAELLPLLLELKERGYSDAEIRDRLAKNKIEISVGTLRQYIAQLRASAGETRKRTPKRNEVKRETNRGEAPAAKPSELASAPRAASGEGKAKLGHKLGDDDV